MEERSEEDEGIAGKLHPAEAQKDKKKAMTLCDVIESRNLGKLATFLLLMRLSERKR